MSANRGLEGVVVGQTRLSHINGEVGELIYAGYDIDDLARNTSFEEVMYLLWNGKLPNQSQLDELNSRVHAAQTLSPEIIQLIRVVLLRHRAGRLQNRRRE